MMLQIFTEEEILEKGVILARFTLKQRRVVACVTGDQNAPVAQVRAGLGPGGATRAFMHPPKSRRGWQEVVHVADAARRQD
jgi:hypothetical protein